MGKFCLFPIAKHNFWKHYKKQLASIWTVEEIDFSDDYKDFITLDNYKQHSIKMILAFFANSDGLVNFNIKNNLLNDFSNEITYTYTFQMFMENIHNETYSLMIDTLLKDGKEKDDIFNSLDTIDIIKKINEWGLKYSEGDYPISIKILVFICFEGIMFSGAFAFIYWLKYVLFQGQFRLKGLVKSNELISRDESFHVDFGIELFAETNLSDNIHAEEIRRIIIECVELTTEFNNEVLQIRYTGLNADNMTEYTKYMADRILVLLGYEKVYKVSNPFVFMNTIGMVQKTNFHESRPTEYQRSNNSDINTEFSDDF